MKKIILFNLLLSLLISCQDEETGFRGGNTEKNTGEAVEVTPPASGDQTAGDWNVEVDEESGKTTYSLTIESEQKVKVDYLFVVDNSNSMNAIISQMQDGFKEIAEKGEFPETARVAVISTAVDEVKNEGAKITGFKKPVDKASIALSERSDKEEKPGCNKGWFKPTDKDANDNYCLTSHTSFKLYGTNAEAGLTAFNNYLDSQADKAFRKDALVNVVFFSDTT